MVLFITNILKNNIYSLKFLRMYSSKELLSKDQFRMKENSLLVEFKQAVVEKES